MFQTPKYHKFWLARNQYSFFMSFWFSGRYKKNIHICFWRKSAKFRLARSALSQPLMGFSRVSGKFLVGINRHEQNHKIITSVTNIRTHCTDKLCDSPTKYWEESHVSDTQKKWLASNHFIAFSRVSGRYVKHFFFRRKSTKILARSISFFSSFLFSSQYNEQDHYHECYEHSHGHIVPTNSDLSTMYILRFEKNRMFSTQIFFLNRLARFAHSRSCLHFLQFPTRRHSIRPYIMNINEHIKWTNTRSYCTDKNMLLTNLTIARFQRKIRKFRLARSQSVTYVFRYAL